MNRLVIIATMLLASMVSYAQVGCFLSHDFGLYKISSYSEPGIYRGEIPSNFGGDEDEYGELIIVKTERNYFRVETRYDNEENVFSGWIKRGDVFTVIENYNENLVINLYTDPYSKIPTGYQIGWGGAIVAIYDLCGKYVLVQVISDDYPYERTHHWGWVHVNHLNASPSSEPGLSHIED